MATQGLLGVLVRVSFDVKRHHDLSNPFEGYSLTVLRICIPEVSVTSSQSSRIIFKLSGLLYFLDQLKCGIAAPAIGLVYWPDTSSDRTHSSISQVLSHGNIINGLFLHSLLGHMQNNTFTMKIHAFIYI